MIRSAAHGAPWRGAGAISLVTLGHLLLGAFLPACGSAEQDPPPLMGVVVQSPHEPFNVSLREAAIRHARELRLGIRVFAPAQPGAPAELDAVRRAVEAEVTALVIATDEPSVLQAAIDSQLPTVVIDPYPESARASPTLESSTFLTHIGSDHERGGFLGCRTLDESIRSSALGTIYLLSEATPAGNVATRLTGCEAYLRDPARATKFAVARRELSANTRAAAHGEVLDLLAQDPTITGMFAASAEIGVGAADALAEANANARVHLVVFDMTAAVAAVVTERHADAAIAQDAPLMGELGVEAAATSFRQIWNLPVKIDSGFVIVTGTSGAAQVERYSY